MVERNLAKVEVASSNLVSRSIGKCGCEIIDLTSTFCLICSLARVVELVDTQDLKSCDLNSRAGSSPAPGTKFLISMKKLIFTAVACVTMIVSSCHYGQNEAKETIERNELYKTEKQDYSINRAGERGKLNATKSDTLAVDTAKK